MTTSHKWFACYPCFTTLHEAGSGSDRGSLLTCVPPIMDVNPVPWIVEHTDKINRANIFIQLGQQQNLITPFSGTYLIKTWQLIVKESDQDSCVSGRSAYSMPSNFAWSNLSIINFLYTCWHLSVLATVDRGASHRITAAYLASYLSFPFDSFVTRPVRCIEQPCWLALGADLETATNLPTAQRSLRIQHLPWWVFLNAKKRWGN